MFTFQLIIKGNLTKENITNFLTTYWQCGLQYEDNEFCQAASELIYKNKKDLERKKLSPETFHANLLKKLSEITSNKLRLEFKGKEATMDKEELKDKKERKYQLEECQKSLAETITSSYSNYYKEKELTTNI